MSFLEILRHSVRGIEILALVVGLFYTSSSSPKNVRSFVVFIGGIVIIELVGWYLYEYKLYQQNVWFYKYFGFPFQYIFLFTFFCKILFPTKWYKWVIVLVSIYIISLIVENNLLNRSGYAWMSISFTIANVLLLVLVITYIYQLAISDQIIEFKTNPIFWFSVGIFIYYLGGFPFYGMFNYLYYNFPKLHLIYYEIVMGLSCLMYVFFIIGFLWQRRN